MVKAKRECCIFPARRALFLSVSSLYLDRKSSISPCKQNQILPASNHVLFVSFVHKKRKEKDIAKRKSNNFSGNHRPALKIHGIHQEQKGLAIARRSFFVLQTEKETFVNEEKRRKSKIERENLTRSHVNRAPHVKFIAKGKKGFE